MEVRGSRTAVAGSVRRQRRGVLLRGTLKALAWTALGAVLAGGALFLDRSPDADDLHGWHRLELADELTTETAGEVATLERYQALEDALWAELRRRQAEWPEARAPLSRYNPGGPLAPGAGGRDWNRTFELAPADPAAGQDAGGGARRAVLLLHGLSDSPYSLRAAGEALAARGHHVVGLRLPGHGTAPGALRGVSWRDWRAAVRLGAQEAVERSGGAPLVVVGYSNGAALGLDYALEALDDPALPAPRRLVFLSPAFAVSPAAAAARWQRRLSLLPGLEALAWESLLPEYDPYKYNSFPIRAAEEIYALTGDLEARLAALAEAGRAGELPPMLTFQSVADATVPAEASLSRLYGRAGDAADELVIFDLNREADVEMFLAPEAGALAAGIDRREPWPIGLTLVTNAAPERREVVARRRPAGAAEAAATPLGLAWPPRVFSLSHVALPFPPDDPVYGLTPPPGREATLGSVEARGERGVLVVPQELLMRLRSNPFFPYLAARLTEFVEADSQVPRTTRSGGAPAEATR